MYEHYIGAFRNGITDISIVIDEESFWDTDANDSIITNDAAITVTITFAVTTDSEAWISINGNGIVSPAFGGTGLTRTELNRHAEQAVRIWRAITGDNKTTCRYKISTTDERNQNDSVHIIDA